MGYHGKGYNYCYKFYLNFLSEEDCTGPLVQGSVACFLLLCSFSFLHPYQKFLEK